MRTSAIGRVAAAGAVIVTAVAVAAVLLSSGGDGHKYTFLFQNAAQLVEGNLVQVSGRPVGSVQDIKLTDDGQAEVDDRPSVEFVGLTATHSTLDWLWAPGWARV